MQVPNGLAAGSKNFQAQTKLLPSCMVFTMVCTHGVVYLHGRSAASSKPNRSPCPQPSAVVSWRMSVRGVSHRPLGSAHILRRQVRRQ